MLAHGRSVRARLAAPNSTRSGSSSTPSTSPVGPVRWASSAVVHPEPLPTSSTRSPGRTSRRRSMAATVRGWELVCPWPMWIGPSSAARQREAFGRNSLRGTAENASAMRSTRPIQAARPGSPPGTRPRTRRGRPLALGLVVDLALGLHRDPGAVRRGGVTAEQDLVVGAARHDPGRHHVGVVLEPQRVGVPVRRGRHVLGDQHGLVEVLGAHDGRRGPTGERLREPLGVVGLQHLLRAAVRVVDHLPDDAPGHQGDDGRRGGDQRRKSATTTRRTGLGRLGHAAAAAAPWRSRRAPWRAGRPTAPRPWSRRAAPTPRAGTRPRCWQVSQSRRCRSNWARSRSSRASTA